MGGQLRSRISTAKISKCGTVRPVFDKPLRIIFMALKIDQSGESED